MPTINLGRKTRKVTINKTLYQSVYQSKRWKRLRAEKFKNNPVCELCERKGITKQTEEIHHIKPFEVGASPDELEALAYDYGNLISLCTECHHKEHQKLKA